MPLPSPKKGEDQNEFMGKCMGDETMKKDFPNQKQRIAVCLSQMKRKKAKAEVLDWDEMSDESFIIY
jgi:hypothetical protein